jgi:hypothetical protein
MNFIGLSAFTLRRESAMIRHCSCCRKGFRPDRFHPHQICCSDPVCQRWRRTRWQREKLRTDADYRGNQADAAARWRAAHPEYWKNYRASHPCVGQRSATLQERGQCAHGSGDVANMDVACSQVPVVSGRYRLEPLEGGSGANMDVAIVQLTVLQAVSASG